jgi:hypothetical protein
MARSQTGEVDIKFEGNQCVRSVCRSMEDGIEKEKELMIESEGRGCSCFAPCTSGARMCILSGGKLPYPLHQSLSSVWRFAFRHT